MRTFASFFLPSVHSPRASHTDVQNSEVFVTNTSEYNINWPCRGGGGKLFIYLIEMHSNTLAKKSSVKKGLKAHLSVLTSDSKSLFIWRQKKKKQSFEIHQAQDKVLIRRTALLNWQPFKKENRIASLLRHTIIMDCKMFLIKTEVDFKAYWSKPEIIHSKFHWEFKWENKFSSFLDLSCFTILSCKLHCSEKERNTAVFRITVRDSLPKQLVHQVTFIYHGKFKNYNRRCFF